MADPEIKKLLGLVLDIMSLRSTHHCSQKLYKGVMTSFKNSGYMQPSEGASLEKNAQTVPKAKKFMEKLGMGINVYMYHLCSNHKCSHIYRNETRDLEVCPCSGCGAPRYKSGGKKLPVRKMFYLSIHDWLLDICNNPALQEMLVWHSSERPIDKEWATDVYDGEVRKTFLSDEQMAAGNKSMAIATSLDGVSPFERANYSFWPIGFSCLNLPPWIRLLMEFTHIAYIIPGPHNEGLEGGSEEEWDDDAQEQGWTNHPHLEDQTLFDRLLLAAGEVEEEDDLGEVDDLIEDLSDVAEDSDESSLYSEAGDTEDEDSENEDQQQQQRAPQPPNNQGYEGMQQPVYTGAKLTVMEVVFFLLQFKRTAMIGKTDIDSLIKFMSRFLLPDDNILPASEHMFKKVLKVPSWDEKQRHVCDRQGCVGYTWDNLPRKQWDAHKDDTRRRCYQPRFIQCYKGGKRQLKPFNWVIELGVEDAIQDMFQDVTWSAERGKARDMGEGSYWTSPECNRMVEKLEEKAIDFTSQKNSTYDLLLDWEEPYNSVAYSVGILGIRNKSFRVGAAALQLTHDKQLQRGLQASRNKHSPLMTQDAKDRSFKAMGSKGASLPNCMLSYCDYNNLFIVPVAHSLLFGVVASFVAHIF
eukprot:gene5292-18536_t